MLAIALTLTGCSAGSLPGSSGGSGSSGSGSSGSGGSGAGNNGSSKIFSADDLVAILKKVETTRSLTGTITDNAQIKADEAKGSSESLTQEFSASGGKIEPAACGTLLDTLSTAGDKYIDQSTWVGASLNATGSDIISVASAPSSSGVSAIIAKTKGIMGQLASQCPSITIVSSAVTIKFEIKDASATTNAAQTYAYEEDIVADGQASKTETIEAIDGNLYIGDVSVTNPNVSDMEANINAVISAANG